MTLDRPGASDYATVDHLYPPGHPLRDTPFAIVLAHTACNERRQHPEDWVAFWQYCLAQHELVRAQERLVAAALRGLDPLTFVMEVVDAAIGEVLGDDIGPR